MLYSFGYFLINCLSINTTLVNSSGNASFPSKVKRNNVHFIILSDDDKFIYLFKSAECYDMVDKTRFNILSRRNSFLYSWWIVY